MVNNIFIKSITNGYEPRLLVAIDSSTFLSENTDIVFSLANTINSAILSFDNMEHINWFLDILNGSVSEWPLLLLAEGESVNDVLEIVLSDKYESKDSLNNFEEFLDKYSEKAINVDDFSSIVYEMIARMDYLDEDYKEQIFIPSIYNRCLEKELEKASNQENIPSMDEITVSTQKQTISYLFNQIYHQAIEHEVNPVLLKWDTNYPLVETVAEKGDINRYG